MSLAVARLTLCWCNGTSVVGTSGNDEIVERNSGSAAAGGADGGGAAGGLVVAEMDDNIVLINLCGNTMNKGVWSTQLRHWTCDGAVQIRITEKSQLGTCGDEGLATARKKRTASSAVGRLSGDGSNRRSRKSLTCG